MRWRGTKRIYFDYAASTPIDPDAARITSEAHQRFFGNPSAVHAEGRDAKEALHGARRDVAAVCGVKRDAVIFTSGATESNNLAIFGVVRARQQEGKPAHVVTSSIEHAATLAACRALEAEGVPVTYVEPDAEGMILPERIAAAVTEETALVTLALANSEIGTIAPIRTIKDAIAKRLPAQAGSVRTPYLHVDAAQAPVYLSVRLHSLGADLLTLDSQKVYGPKGVGALIVLPHVRLEPIFFGGGQERGLRPGTENVALALGFAHALARADGERKTESARVTLLRDALKRDLANAVPNIRWNGSFTHRLPNNLSFTIPDVNHDYLSVILDTRGIATATGSACTAQGIFPSHVLEALAPLSAGPESSAGGLRVTLGRGTRARDCARLVKVLKTALTEFDKI